MLINTIFGVRLMKGFMRVEMSRCRLPDSPFPNSGCKVTNKILIINVFSLIFFSVLEWKSYSKVESLCIFEVVYIVESVLVGIRDVQSYSPVESDDKVSQVVS